MIKNIFLSKSLYILGLVFWSLCGFSQDLKKVSGKVVDKQTNEPIVGAAIQVLNTKKQIGTTSDTEGDFTLNVPENAEKIKVSIVGYTSKEVTITGSVLAILLEPGQILDEVVVTALGLERQSKNLGYALQKLDGKEISNTKAVNFLDNLAGKVAGLTVVSGSTGVGGTSRISIRGESSFTNTNPLFVVDGIPINNNTIINNVNDDANGFMEVDFGNGAMEVNPDDIASVSVLKGPSAAALYGTRASNGVIVITTKKGSPQKGLGISFNSTFFSESPFKLPQFQNTFGQGNSGAFAYKNGLGGGVNDNITYSYGPKLDAGINVAQFDSPVTLPNGSTVRAGDIAVYSGQAITPTPFNSQPNNLKDFYQTGNTTINNLAISGGFDKGNYRLSLTNLDSKSIIPGVDLQRKNISTSLNFSPIQKLKISSNINYVNSSSDNRPATKYGSENVNYSLVAWLGRSNNIESLRNYWQPGLENVEQYSFNYTYFDNPFFTLYENRNGFNRDRVFGNISAKYDFTPELSLSVRSGIDNQIEKRTFRRNFSSNRFKQGAYAEQNVLYKEVNTDFLLNYNKNVGDFIADFSAGGNRMDQNANMDQTQTLSLAQPGIFSFSNAASPLEYYQTVGRKRINSLYGLAKFSYKNYLFLDITGRNDWSSSLASISSSANTSFFYPSVSGSFVVSNLVNLPESISFAKIRASIASVGNDTNPFQTAGTFVSSTAVGGLPTFTDQTQIANANLKPEQITSVEVGADVRFFNDRLKIDVTYFNSLNKNQILSLPIAVSSGYDQRSINGGAVRSHGFEAILGIDLVRNSPFKWNTNFNFSMYKNIVESLPDGAKTITLAYNRIYDNVNQTIWYQVKEGGRMGDMYGTGYKKNEAGQFIIGSDGRYIVDNTLIKLGNYNPDFILGMYNTFSYKDFSANLLLDWRQGGQLVSRTLALAGVAGQLKETENRPEAGIVAEGVVNVGTVESPVYQPNTKAVSAETYYRMYYDRNHEENNTYDASYLKIREASITYRLPIQYKRIENVTVSVIGRNLFAFSKIPHFDPEQFGIQGQKLMSGVEDMSYATSRSVGFKLGLNF
jgi:TonB-linked SusC/RagA family outer membrane protein